MCFAVNSVTTVFVNRLPITDFSGLKASYQIDDPSGNLKGFPAGGIFSGPGIIINTNTFVPAIADTGTHAIRYTFTDANTCTNYSEQFTTVFALPEVEVGNPGPYCFNYDPIDHPLPRTTKVGFTDSWSGNNVFSQIIGGKLEYFFNIPVAGVGSHTVTYTIKDDGTGSSTNEDTPVLV